MRLISLELANFRQHKATRIEFPSGVTGIIGRNGSGKTTLLEAIAWALYGQAGIRGSNDTVRCRSAEGSSPVEARLVFALGAHTYLVVRRMEPSGKSSAQVIVDDTPVCTGVRDVTDYITKLLGMDYQAFFTSFFTAQKELEFLRGLSGQDRAKAISRMLGFERLTHARDRANQARLDIEKEIRGLEQGLGDPEEIKLRRASALERVQEEKQRLADVESSLSAAAEQVEKLKPQKELSDERSRRYSELVRRLELDRSQKKQLEEKITYVRSQIAQLEAKKSELEELLPKDEKYLEAGREYRELQKLRDAHLEREKLRAEMGAVESDIAALSARIKSLQNAEAELENVESKLAETEKELTELDNRISTEKEKQSALLHRAEAELKHLNELKKEVVEKRRTIIEAGAEGICPTCERPLGSELLKVIEGFDRQIARLEERAAELSEEIEKLRAEPESVKSTLSAREALSKTLEELTKSRGSIAVKCAELSRIREELSAKQFRVREIEDRIKSIPSGFDPVRFSELHKIGEELRPVHEKVVALKAEVARLESLRLEEEETKKSLSGVSREIENSEESLKELDFTEEQHKKIVQAYEEASERFTSARIAVEKARGELKAAEESLALAEDEEKRFQARSAMLKAKRQEVQYLKAVSEAMAALRADLSNRAAPELAAAASEILAEVTDGRYTTLEVNENYEAWIREDGEIKEVISGGEQDIVNLALRLAVSRMIADRAGQDLSLLVLDEVFGSLDEMRRENLVLMLSTLKTRFDQIILITHIESIHDAVDNCIWVDYDESTRTSSVSVGSTDAIPDLVAVV